MGNTDMLGKPYKCPACGMNTAHPYSVPHCICAASNMKRYNEAYFGKNGVVTKLAERYDAKLSMESTGGQHGRQD